MAYVLAEHKDEAFIQLKELLEPFGIQQFYTEGRGAYQRHLDKGDHTVGKCNTQKIERKHLTLRTRTKRLARKTICFSKSTWLHGSPRALELAEFVREKGRFAEVHRALFKAFFEDGHDLDNMDVLIKIGTAVNFDCEELRTALEQETYRERVIHDQRQAAELGTTAVPTVMISQATQPLEEAEVIPGAQRYKVVRAAVECAARQE